MIHLHALVFAWPQRPTSPCFLVPALAFNLKQMIVVGGEHDHLGETSGVYKKKKKEEEEEERVYGQIHLWLLQSISHLKKYTITRRERAKIYDLETPPLTSIDLVFLAPSLAEWLSLTLTMINCLSLLFYKYISFI